MKKKLLVLLAILFFLHFNTSFGQLINEEQFVELSSRIDNPIQIEVLANDDQLKFIATNRSQYPYQLIIRFMIFQNLTPMHSIDNITIMPGVNHLFDLTIKNKQVNHNYSYSVKCFIGDPGKKAILDYPYLFPLKVGSSFKKLKGSNRDSTLFFTDHYKLENTDTIYCMRKGRVTSVTGMYHKTDKISNRESVEIMHNDGTVMIYENIDPNKCFVNLGDNINPGEPIGIINDSKLLRVFLYSFKNEGRLKRLKINYYIDENNIKPFSPSIDTVKIAHPYEIITKEMTKREIKKYNQKHGIKK